MAEPPPHPPSSSPRRRAFSAVLATSPVAALAAAYADTPAMIATAVLVAAALAALVAHVTLRRASPMPGSTGISTGPEGPRDVDPDAQQVALRIAAQREELQMLTRRLMTLQEDERAALSRELHDDIGQAITAIKLCASALLGPGAPPPGLVAETADEIAQIADQTVVKLRDLSLLLRPPQLDALGLEAALRWQAGRLFRGDVPALSLAIEALDCRPPREVELACFRIAQEALTNVLRHARATQVHLQVRCDDSVLRLMIEDDGVGMPADGRAGLGLVTMRERAQQLGGTFAIASRPGRTRIDVALPLGPVVPG